MEIICPVCQNAHTNRFSEDSDWCADCANSYLHTIRFSEDSDWCADCANSYLQEQEDDDT